MPIEIKELHIKGTIANDSGQSGNNGGAVVSDEQKQALVEAIVEKVLRVLDDKKER